MNESGFLSRCSDAFGRPVSLGSEWRWLFSVGLCCYLLNLGLRLSLWTLWDNPLLRVGDEFIMATHDSYWWLAQARGAEFGSSYSLALLTRWLHEIFGLGLGTIGFWTPAFISSLVIIPCVLWGWLLGGKNGCLFAGIVGALTPGFYARTRLGYYDTDMFTLLLPLLTVFFLAWWLNRHVAFPWVDGGKRNTSSTWLPIQVLVIGLFARFAGWWHQDIANYIGLLALVHISVGLIFCGRERRVPFLHEASIFLLAGVAGSAWTFYSGALAEMVGGVKNYALIVLALAACLSIWMSWRAHKERGNVGLAIALPIFLLAIYVTGFFSGPLDQIYSKLLLYLKPAATELADKAVSTGPIYPRVTQSIIEAKNIPFEVVLERTAYFSWLGIGALLAMIPVVFFRPVAVLLLPLVLLSVLSMKMGVRFGMFGGAPLMILLGVGCTALCRVVMPSGEYRERILTVVMVTLGLVLLLPRYAEYRKVPPTPVLDKAHAEALIGLGERAPEDAQVWTWWDWGYATQYYAGLNTPSDGARHAGNNLYPTAVALATSSPLRANQIMRYSAGFPGADPSTRWNTGSGSEARTLVARLGEERTALPQVAKQYIAVSYRDLRIAKWIMFYGNWDLERGTTKEPVIRRFGPGQMAFNLELGGVMNRSRQRNVIATADIMDQGSSRHYSYPRNTYSPHLVPGTPHLVFNKLAGESIFFDENSYDSMLVRLFTGDPESEEIKPYFRLVADGLPFIRIYEVLQN